MYDEERPRDTHEDKDNFFVFSLLLGTVLVYIVALVVNAMVLSISLTICLIMNILHQNTFSTIFPPIDDIF